MKTKKAVVYFPKNIPEWIEGILNLIGEGFRFLKENGLFGFAVKYPILLFFVADVMAHKEVTIMSWYPIFLFGGIAILYFGGYMFLEMREAWLEEEARRARGEDENEKL